MYIDFGNKIPTPALFKQDTALEVTPFSNIFTISVTNPKFVTKINFREKRIYFSLQIKSIIERIRAGTQAGP